MKPTRTIAPFAGLVLMLAACAPPGTAARAGADVSTETSGSAGPTPVTAPIPSPLPDPVPPGAIVPLADLPADLSPFGADGQLTPEMQWVMAEYGITVEEAVRRDQAADWARLWFTDHQTGIDYRVQEHDPFRFVFGSQDPDLALPSTIGGYPVVLERPPVSAAQLQRLQDLVTSTLSATGLPWSGAPDPRTGTYEVSFSHQPVADALAGIAEKLSALAPARLVVDRVPMPSLSEPPPDAIPLVRFPAMPGSGPEALATGRLTISTEGCVRFGDAPPGVLPNASTGAVEFADWIDLVITPDRIVWNGEDLGPPGPNGPVFHFGGGGIAAPARTPDPQEPCRQGEGFAVYSVAVEDRR